MLDLRSLCISGTVFNLAAAPGGSLQFLSPSLSGCLASARVVIAGVEASSCDHIGRVEHVLSLLQSDDDQRSDFNAGFGLKEEANTDLHGQFKTDPILAGSSRNATWKPRSLGILQCDSYLPISMISGNLVLELTFLDDPKAGLNTTSPNGEFYNVSELTCHVDVLSLDPTFLTNLSQHLLDGNSGISPCYRQATSKMWKAFWANSGHKSLQKSSANLK
jgi:hypothetical protein